MEDQFVKISKANAVKAFKSANHEGKALLQNLIGKDVLSENIMDRIKSYADACLDQGIIPRTIEDFSGVPEEDQGSTYAFHQLTTIVRSLNEGWKPDYSNANEYKYHNWFQYAAGSGFSFDGYAHDRSGSNVGARLVFKNRQLAEYAAKQFQSIYNQYLSL